jgi:hypothetical protein
MYCTEPVYGYGYARIRLRFPNYSVARESVRTFPVLTTPLNKKSRIALLLTRCERLRRQVSLSRFAVGRVIVHFREQG